MKLNEKQKGFALTEFLLAMVILGIVLGGSYAGYKTLSSSTKDTQNTSAMVNLLAGVKQKWQGLGDYSGVTDANVEGANLVTKPLSWDGANILNAYNQTIVFDGNASNFSAEVSVPPEKCIETIGSLDGVAYRMDVHTAGVAIGTAEDGTKTVKAAAAGTIDAAKASTQCGGATTVITAWVK